jgi:hypothetical protein
MKGTEGHRYGLGTISVPQFANLGRDFIESLIPSNLLPFVFATTADALQRPMDSSGSVMQFGRLRALDADETLARGMVLVASDFRYAIVTDVNHNAALLGTTTTDNLLRF